MCHNLFALLSLGKGTLENREDELVQCTSLQDKCEIMTVDLLVVKALSEYPPLCLHGMVQQVWTAAGKVHVRFKFLTEGSWNQLNCVFS